MTSNLKSGIAKFGDFDTYFMPTYELIDNNIGGTVYAWGPNVYGSYGNNTGSAAYSVTPLQVRNSYFWKKVVPVYGGQASLTLTHNGDLYASGGNIYGILGINYPAASNISNPIQISGSSSNAWVDVEGPRALKADGTLWVWGEGFYGQIGDNARIDRSSPVQVVHPNGSKWSKLSLDTFGRTNLYIDEYGYLWGCGYNGVGNLGINSLGDRSTPVQVGSDTWSYVTVGLTTASAGIKTDGTLWTWGMNSFGILGLGLPTTDSRSTPVQVGTSKWKHVSMGDDATLAIKEDGTLWAWGYNNWGGLGVGDTDDRSTPTQVGTGSDWKFAMTQSSAAAAVKTDGTLWTWGYAGLGSRLGLLGWTGSAHRSTPTQVTDPYVKWKSVRMSGATVLGTSAGQGAAGAPTYHVTDTQSTAGCYSGQGGFSLDIVNGQAIMYFGLWPSDPPNCQTCYGAWLAFGGLGVDRTGANSGSNGWRIATNTRPYWGMGGAPLNLTAIPVGTTTYWQSSNWPYTLVGYTYAVTKTTSNSITIQTYPNSWGTGDTGTSVSVYNWFDRVNTLWGGYNAGKAGYVLGTGTFTW